MTRVLVAYASKMGSTREIALAVGAELRGRGLLVDVSNVVEVTSLEGYDAVVLGSAVYMGRWRPEAVRFLKRYGTELAGRSVWLFESGWVGKRPDALVATTRARRAAERAGAAAAPAVFGGRLDPALASGWLDRGLARRVPGDERDFDEIRSWAGTVADSIAARARG